MTGTAATMQIEENLALAARRELFGKPFLALAHNVALGRFLTFLEVNGVRMDCTNEDVARVGLAVADGSMGYEELLDWVRKHREDRSMD